MATLKTKVRKALSLFGFGFLVVLVFVADAIRGHGTIDLDGGVLGTILELMVVGEFVLFYSLLETTWKRDQSPAKKLGFALVIMIVVATASAALSFVPTNGFDTKESALIPLGFDSVALANVFGIVLGSTMVMTLMIIRDIILWKRRKTSQRNFLILLGLMGATALSTLTSRPLASGLTYSILFGVTMFGVTLNSFRLSWIVYLSKREKLYSMVYGFILFGIFIGLSIMTTSGTVIGKSLLFYSPPLKSFVSMMSIFGCVYFGMTFLSTMFHLPTADAYDRKISEVASLHNLSRLITQVFDFNELVESVTRMTLDVCQAQSAWLEIFVEDEHSKLATLNNRLDGRQIVRTVALNNITEDETTAIISAQDGSLRKIVLEARKPVVIDDVLHDRRTIHVREFRRKFGSLVIAPLMTHDTVIGILYATKEMALGFDKEDVDLIAAFADQATIAIENSRLIEKSLERERLMREIMVAQEMQKKLLPQELPAIVEVEIEALSTPAFEVGGDYYDFTMLDEHHIGFIVGDVSGKGVSAAFYMAEMKGIFQSLSKIYREPKDFLTKAHAALSGTMDKRSFISVIYAVLDLRDGTMKIARAGHCPMLYLSGESARYITPLGLGLGMGNPELFERTIRQESMVMKPGDAALFFTDGLTEARPVDGEEYGYEKLKDLGCAISARSASGMKDAVIESVDIHMNHQPPEDDLTLLVVKWRGKGS